VGAATHIKTSLYLKMSNVEAAFRNLHQDLLDGCKEGDQKAQFQIYKLYYKAMYNTSLRIVNDTMEAEDIMQESFLSAFEKIGTVSFGAWLKKIVVNRSLDALNKRKAVFEDIESHVGIRDESGDDTARNEEVDIRVEEVKEAIERLPDGYRVILSLYLLEGYDHDEIAEILSINSSTSRSQLSRAKQKLIAELKGK
jgi:RNA polymerase sigma factor (sigma-70 family)